MMVSRVKITRLVITKRIDRTGMVYGRLTVIRFVVGTGTWAGGNRVLAKWLCKCECGVLKEVVGQNLISGNTRSCGCLRVESRFKHGDGANSQKNRLYSVWRTMKSRTTNPNFSRAEYYFHRGIGICDEWLDYIQFKKWALENGYRYGLSIDRIDNDKGYSPENCRWTTQSVQMNNCRTTKKISFQNNEIPRADFCRKFNLEYRQVEYLHSSKKMNGEEILAKLLGNLT